MIGCLLRPAGFQSEQYAQQLRRLDLRDRSLAQAGECIPLEPTKDSIAVACCIVKALGLGLVVRTAADALEVGLVEAAANEKSAQPIVVMPKRENQEAWLPP